MPLRIPTRSLIAAALSALLIACGSSDSGIVTVDSQGSTTVDAAALDATLQNYPSATLSIAEAEGIAYMREEERLAQDVYAASATHYSLPIFANISASEATHTEAVRTLIERYQLADPLAGTTNGVFPTPAFQTLYDDLVAASAVSLVEALKVGVQIEELDIRDIEARKVDVDQADILLVYDNLLRGSRNHLRAYMNALLARDGSYTPQYITQEAFDAIVNSPIETGG
ncbi:MAG: DUF2202 domain-containing protein [Burkholderiaceae bacterium]